MLLLLLLLSAACAHAHVFGNVFVGCKAMGVNDLKILSRVNTCLPAAAALPPPLAFGVLGIAAVDCCCGCIALCCCCILLSPTFVANAMPPSALAGIGGNGACLLFVANGGGAAVTVPYSCVGLLAFVDPMLA